ncbi:hypothetical protein VCHENC02_2902, partial [Vibrio harveyi]
MTFFTYYLSSILRPST